MAGRFIKLYDKILSWEWYKNTNTKVLFLHLLLRANYKDMRFEGHDILRGQLVTSLVSLSAELGLSIKQIRGSLDHLISTGEVTSKTYPRYRVITIVRYDEYQANDSQNGSQTAGERAGSGQSKGRVRASSGQAQGNQRATSIEYIEQKEGIEKVEQIESTASNASDLEEKFEEFWENYPRRIAKQTAKKAFEKLRPDDDLFVKMLKSLEKWKQTNQWQENDGQYVPYPATWLNGRRWEDDVPTAKPAVKQAAPAKQVIAQQYEQRDYSGRQDSMEDVLRQLEEEGYI